MAENNKDNKQVEVEVPSSKNNLQYHGRVNVQIQKNGKIVKTKLIKNKGYEKLFNFVIYALTGVINNGLYPKYVLLCNHSEDSNTILSTPRLEGRVYVDTTDGFKAVHKFIVPYLSFTNTQKDINRVVLCCQESLTGIGSEPNDEELESEASAIVDLEDAIDIQSLDVSTSILVNWSMTIDDITDESEENN